MRSRFFSPPKDMASYYSTVVSKVRAEAQAKAVKFLIEEDFLSDSEREILRWGRNASGTLPKRLASSNLTREIYRGATALECLVCFLRSISLHWTIISFYVGISFGMALFRS